MAALSTILVCFQTKKVFYAAIRTTPSVITLSFARPQRKRRITTSRGIFSQQWVMHFGFIASKDVVVAPWFKNLLGDLRDSSGELLTIYLDVTLPALHQEAIVSCDEVYNNARKAKAAAYPRKDSSGL